MSTASSLHRQDVACQRGAAVRRWGALLGGGALAVYGLTRRSLPGLAIAGAGGALVYAGAKANSVPRGVSAHATMLVNCSPQEAYQFWRQFENLPVFMTHLDAVTQIGDRKYRWEVPVAGSHITWDVEIISERENQGLAWRSVPGAETGMEGSVEFQSAPADRGTLVVLTMQHVFPTGTLGRALAKIFGKYPEFVLRQDLRRFKALVETGEIPTTEGQSHGPRSTKIAVLRLADPNRPIRPESDLKEALRAMRRIA
jgi:uncharacterized membrane protein